jgi:cell division protein FtsL
MIKPGYIITLLLFCACVYGLFQVKFRVQHLHLEMAEIQKQLEHEKDSIHVLKAEWAYLNQPERLQRLAEKHLKLAEVKSEQIMIAQTGSIIIAQIKEAKPIMSKNSQLIQASLTSDSSIKKPRPIKWRYKERPEILIKRKK